MKKLINTLLLSIGLITFGFSAKAQFGNGTYGDLTVNNGDVVYTDSARKLITTGNLTIPANRDLMHIGYVIVDDAKDFYPKGSRSYSDEKLLIIQMDHYNYNQPGVSVVGNYAIVRMTNIDSSVSGEHKIYFDTLNVYEHITGAPIYPSLNAAFPETNNNFSRSQVIKIPQYNTVHVQPGGTITCHNYLKVEPSGLPDLGTGGVLCFMVKDSLVIQPGGVIDASKKGYYNRPLTGKPMGGVGGAGGLWGSGGISAASIGDGGNGGDAFQYSAGSGGNKGITKSLNPSTCSSARKGGDGGAGSGPIPPLSLPDTGMKAKSYFNAVYSSSQKQLIMGMAGDCGSGGRGGEGGGGGGGGGGGRDLFGQDGQAGFQGANGGTGGFGGNGGGAIYVRAKYLNYNVPVFGNPTVAFRADGFYDTPDMLMNGTSPDMSLSYGKAGNGGNGGGSSSDPTIGGGGGGGHGWRGSAAGGGCGGNGGAAGPIWLVCSSGNVAINHADLRPGLGGSSGIGGQVYSFVAANGLDGSQVNDGNFCTVYKFDERTCACKRAYELLTYTNDGYMVGDTMYFVSGDSVKCKYRKTSLTLISQEIKTIPGSSTSGGVVDTRQYVCKQLPSTGLDCRRIFDTLFAKILVDKDTFHISHDTARFNAAYYFSFYLNGYSGSCQDDTCTAVDTTCIDGCPTDGPTGIPGLEGPVTPASKFVVEYVEDVGNQRVAQVKTDLPQSEKAMNNAGLDKLPQGVKVYPNPTKGKIFISLPSDSKGDCQIELYDRQGKLVFRRILPVQHPLELDIAGIASGAYLMKFSSQLHNFQYNIIVE